MLNDMKMKLILEAIDKASPELRKVETQVKQLDSSSTTASQGGVKKLGTSLGPAGLAGIAAATGVVVGKLSTDILSAGMAWEALDGVMDAATGSQRESAVEMEYVREQARYLGLELETAAGGYAKLSAAARGTAMDQKDVRQIWQSLAETSTVLRLSGEQTAGALRAVEQIMSKGTVQAEELRGQLGERIPGAFQIAARAMGVTTQELNKMLEQGQVLSDDFLPKFASQLRQEFGDQVPAAVSKMNAALGRSKTVWFELMTALADGTPMQAATQAIDAVTEAVDRLRKALAPTKNEVLTDLRGELAHTLEQLAAAEKMSPFLQAMYGGLDSLKEKAAALRKEIAALTWQDDAEAQLKNAAAHIAVQPAPTPPVSESTGTPMADIKKSDINGPTHEDMLRQQREYSDYLEEADAKKQQLAENETLRLAERISAVQQALMSETEIVEQSYQSRLQTIQQATAAELLTLDERDAMLIEAAEVREAELARIAEEGAAKQNAVRTAQMNAGMSMASLQLGQMAGMMDQGNKKQFQTYKALAIVQTGISTVQAVMNALAVPPYPVGLALSITAGALGAANMARLSSMEYQGGKEAGGWVLPNRSVIVGERGPELLTVGSEGGTITPNHKLGGSSTSQSVRVTNVFQLSPGVPGTVQAEVLRAVPLLSEHLKVSVQQAIAEGELGYAGGRR